MFKIRTSGDKHMSSSAAGRKRGGRGRTRSEVGWVIKVSFNHQEPFYEIWKKLAEKTTETWKAKIPCPETEACSLQSNSKSVLEKNGPKMLSNS